MTIEIGQTLYEPRERSSSFREHKVVSIGRKWIALDTGNRCTIDRLMLDCGGYSPRQLYASAEEYESGARLDAAWRDLRNDLQYHKIPKGMTVERINDVRRMLGLKVLGED